MKGNIQTMSKSNSTISYCQNTLGQSVLSLSDCRALPNASGYLWNRKMVTQVNCRGYVVSQFMQPEPCKYSHGPSLEAKTFIQPEHPYFAHHPGRFFYIKDVDSGQCFSAPYEPMKIATDSFEFSITTSDVTWKIVHLDLSITIVMSLTTDDVVERWSFEICNLSDRPRKISIYPYFSIGYMSWMNQSATFEPSLNAIVARSITPYQKVEQYFENKHLKDLTFLACDKTPTAWLANQRLFEGHGGLHNPDALLPSILPNEDARYETPVAVMQFDEALKGHAKKTLRFIFGPAQNDQEVACMKDKYLSCSTQAHHAKKYADYLAQGAGCIQIKSDNHELDNFVNHWLPRQVFYHGDVNRLSSDPQTRNYIQDNMGMCFIEPNTAKKAFVLALSQQHIDGSMPDGILLHDKAELKFINQVPHSDHCVWLPICIASYLGETGDTEFLSQHVGFSNSDVSKSLIEHIELSLRWLLKARDERGLSYIEQGDWCDPMNMVGYQGKGVSAWLSLATAYAINCWCDLCDEYSIGVKQETLEAFREQARAINQAVSLHLFDGRWFARGITDNGRVFGVKEDKEGRIFLNPQSWAMLSGAANKDEVPMLMDHINEQLMTPYGAMMLAPSFTQMVEDVGRVTQKHPGVSENGSVYNHAGIFYAYSLFQNNQNDAAYDVLIKMLPSIDKCLQTGQMPNFIPNYYRGAYHQFSQHAGRSSHLFNTGTISWFYRCVIEELCGLKGGAQGLIVEPKLPSKLSALKGIRHYRGATIHFDITRQEATDRLSLLLDGQAIVGNVLPPLNSAQSYQLSVVMPPEGCRHE